jgi:hypothetical protein
LPQFFWGVISSVPDLCGKTIEKETSELRFKAINMDLDFVRKISDLSDGMTA